MILTGRFRLFGWRRSVALAFAAGIEAWLLLTPGVEMDDPAFEALCALSCWLPAWVCADLLSTRTGRSERCPEWSPREAARRAWVRLIPSLAILGIWSATFTYRSLREELALPTPRFISNINRAEDLIPVWIAWTTVFLASAFAYGGGAALCSALARRSRRWLVAPAVVVGASLMLTLIVWVIGSRQQGNSDPLPYLGAASPVDAIRNVLAVPNYVLGSTTALLVSKQLPEPQVEWLAQVVRPGISLFCWIATAFFTSLGTAAWLGAGWITRNRYRRHPNTSEPEPAVERNVEEAAFSAG